MLEGKRRSGGWIPNPAKYPVSGTLEHKKGVLKPAQAQGDVAHILSPINDEKIEGDKTTSRTPKGKIGRKLIDLPDKIIEQMVNKGFGSKAIASELASKGYRVSYRTIHRRILKGNKEERGKENGN